MSKDLQRPIRVLDVSVQELVIEQALKAKDFPDLQSMLFANDSGENFCVQIKAGFNKDAKALALLDLELTGSLQVTCQRCLAGLDICLDHHKRFILVNDEKQAKVFVDNVDEVYVLSSQESDNDLRNGELDMVALLTEEMMLAIPFYPRHENEKDCTELGWNEAPPDSGLSNKENELADDMQRPFANLKDLI